MIADLRPDTPPDIATRWFRPFHRHQEPEPQLEEMFTVPDVDGATLGAALERYELNGRVIWGRTGARPGCYTVVAATRDLSRTVVHPVNSTDAKGDGLAVVQRFAFPAFSCSRRPRAAAPVARLCRSCHSSRS